MAKAHRRPHVEHVYLCIARAVRSTSPLLPNDYLDLFSISDGCIGSPTA